MPNLFISFANEEFIWRPMEMVYSAPLTFRPLYYSMGAMDLLS